MIISKSLRIGCQFLLHNIKITLVDLKNEILGVIKAVDDEELRIILEKRYLNYEAWTDIADDLCVGVDNVYKLHKKALQKVKLPKSLQ